MPVSTSKNKFSLVSAEQKNLEVNLEALCVSLKIIDPCIDTQSKILQRAGILSKRHWLKKLFEIRKSKFEE